VSAYSKTKAVSRPEQGLRQGVGIKGQRKNQAGMYQRQKDYRGVNRIIKKGEAYPEKRKWNQDVKLWWSGQLRGN